MLDNVIKSIAVIYMVLSIHITIFFQSIPLLQFLELYTPVQSTKAIIAIVSVTMLYFVGLNAPDRFITQQV